MGYINKLFKFLNMRYYLLITWQEEKEAEENDFGAVEGS